MSIIMKKENSYGLSENEHYYCIVEYTQSNISHHWKRKPAELLQIFSGNSRIIKAIPHHIIWRRVFYLPKQCTKEVIYQQVIQRIRQELPISLSEVQFDYQVQPLDDRFRIALFVVKKSVIQSLNYIPNVILDCELHCIARALHYLNQLPMDNIYEYSYPLGDRYFHFTYDGVVVSNIHPKDTHLIPIPSTIFDEIERDNLTYIIALGASLWNGLGLI